MKCTLFTLISFCLLLWMAGCRTKKDGSKFRERVVPIAINIKGNSHELNMVNMDIYRLKIVDDLQQFQNVELDLVSSDENPEITLDLDFTSFIIWPKDERTYRRVFQRVVAVGNDASGRPIYQTVTATVDITETKVRSNARFITKLTFKHEQPGVFQRTFAPTHVYQNITTGNIQGDLRAVDPGIMSAGSPRIDPTEDDFLLALSRVEMVRRLSDEIRKKYR